MAEQLPLYLEKAGDDRLLETARRVDTSSPEQPYEKDPSSQDLGKLLGDAETTRRLLERTESRVSAELKRRGLEKVKTIQGCEVRMERGVQILTGEGMKRFHTGANEKESHYVGVEIGFPGVSAYDQDYPDRVHRASERFERANPKYLITWDGKHDHPINLWIPISEI